MLAAISWDGEGNDLLWSNPRNWSNDEIPSAVDSVTIQAPGNVTINYDLPTISSIRSLTLRDNLRVSQGGLTVAENFDVQEGLLLSVIGTSQPRRPQRLMP
jgi:hypothetical protein